MLIENNPSAIKGLNFLDMTFLYVSSKTLSDFFLSLEFLLHLIKSNNHHTLKWDSSL